jgi:2-polyprenyl-6-methoxyphenol hydroxylase-like FAD-dependent oxidoreductase
MVLADSLAANPTLTEGLSHYTRARRAHLRFYQFASRWLTPFFQSDLRFLGAPRDWLMGLMCRLPYFRGQMIRSMVGIKRGILRPSIALPPAPRLLASPRES